MNRLLTYGKQQRISLFIQSFFAWLPSVIVFLAFYVVLAEFFNQSLSPVLHMFLLSLFVLQMIYILVLRKFVLNHWAYAAKKEIKEAYLQALYHTETELDEATILQSDLRGLDSLDSFYQVFFPEIIKLILGYLPLLFLFGITRSPLFLYPIIGILAIGVLMRIHGKRGKQINRRYLASFTALGKRFLNDLSGMNTLIMYQADETYQKAFEEESEFFRKKTMDVLFYQLQSLFILTTILFVIILLGIISIYFAWSAHQFSTAFAISLTIYFIQLILSGRAAGYFFHIVQSSKQSLNRIFTVIDHDKHIVNEEKSTENDLTPITNITFTDVAFAHNPENPLLEQLNFTLIPGKVFGLVGKNGSGKSTIANLIQHKLIPTKGTISFNNTDIQRLDPNIMRQHVGYLGSQSYLFDMSIKENICLGMSAGTDWQTILKTYGLCEFVATLPDGFSTQVGENGKRLSPGQRQQVAFARLLLSFKDVYIFDEISSNIDKKNRQKIVDAMKQLSKTTIVLMISHSWQDITQAEQILFIDNQHIVTGSHQMLYQNNSTYQQLANTFKNDAEGGNTHD